MTFSHQFSLYVQTIKQVADEIWHRTATEAAIRDAVRAQRALEAKGRGHAEADVTAAVSSPLQKPWYRRKLGFL